MSFHLPFQVYITTIKNIFDEISTLKLNLLFSQITIIQLIKDLTEIITT